MRLASLLAEAAAAPPERRIQWRDRIAPFGRRAIDGVEPWLFDGVLAAFAIRVIWRAGELGEPAAAVTSLRAVRGRLPVHLQRDVDWALRSLQPMLRPLAARAEARTAPVAARSRRPAVRPRG